MKMIRDSQKQAKALVDLMNVLCLQQYIDEPTRVDDTLDLFMINNENIAHTVNIVETPISDHNLILHSWYKLESGQQK